METIALGMDGMTLDMLVRIARQGANVKLTSGAGDRIQHARAALDGLDRFTFPAVRNLGRHRYSDGRC